MSLGNQSTRATQVIASGAASPINVKSVDNINNITQSNVGQSLNASAGGQLAQSLQQNSPSVSSMLSGANTSNSIPNPLNDYANYTYHIRLSLLSIDSVYTLDGTYAGMNNSNRIIIAESGVTAGFNILEFEYTDLCAPGPAHMNTTNTTWTMTITEPYGMSFIDKMFTAAGTLNVKNWSRSPYVIEVWFTGYKEDGTIMEPTIFYTQYRVTFTDIKVKVTEGGSVYTIEGCFDGNIGHSNEISVPVAKFKITAKNVKEFFSKFQDYLNSAKPDYTVETASDGPAITYQFNIHPTIQDWVFKGANLDEVSQRVCDTVIDPITGETTFSSGKGASMESIINAVIATCPQSNEWIQFQSASGGSGSGLLSTTGLSTWILLHSFVKLTTFNTSRNDYNRLVTYSLILYNSIIGTTDRNSVDKLSDSGLQNKKLQYLVGKKALVKEYDYIYTGLNTEVINFDISIDAAWQVSIPLWSAMNSYYNYTQGPKYSENSPGNSSALGTYVAPSNSALPNTSGSSSTSSKYAEDLIPSNQNKIQFPTVVTQKNMPAAQHTDVFGDASPAIGSSTGGSDSGTMPQSRALAGTFLQNLFGQTPSFMNIELEIRGDPYWMGSGNVVDDSLTVLNLMPGAQNLPSTTAPAGVRANFLASTVMFLLSFRTGENYNQNTGIMTFENSSVFYNGAYGVIEVTNSFKSGSFTQTLKAVKDVFAQSADNTSAAPNDLLT